MYLLLFMLAFLVNGCATSRSASVYTEGQALQAEDVEEGVVESVEPAVIRKDESLLGSAGGAVLGGIAASTVGGGKGKDLATAVGAIAGGLIGHFVEQGVTDRSGYKIVVRLRNGEKVVVVQEADVAFQKGERVNVFSSRVDNTKRVSKI
jgi:outer membrane lipoprotein SlyB